MHLKKYFGLGMASLVFIASVAGGQQPAVNTKARLIIMADMGNEPDEEQQMAHMLLCSNMFDVEGLIAVTGKYVRPEDPEAYRQVTHPELFIKLIDGYAQVVDNLKKHATGWHDPDTLRSVVTAGQKGYGMGDVAVGKSSPGSELITKVVTKNDPRPVWIVANAGSNTLAQALVDYRAHHSPAEVDAFVAKLRVFENGAQDNSGAWICSEFPHIHWIRSNYQTYAYGGPGGLDGDVSGHLGPHFWQPYEYSVAGQNEWLKEHVMNNHGALGAVYPERRHHGFMHGDLGFMEGGGTIPWMGLVNHGLFDIDHPSWGGWGGRFSAQKVACFWSRHGDIRVDEEKVAPFYTHREVTDTWTNPQTGETLSSDYVPVWRWRPAMYSDLKCRMDWCVMPYEKANHHPIAAFGGDTRDSIVRLLVSPGDTVDLDASATRDPDGDPFEFTWWQYAEAGTYPGQVHIPAPAKAKTTITVPTGAAKQQIHIILEVRDQNSIGLLTDYRRIVIDVTETYNHNKLFKQTI
ncbi:nucleoside hydrolase-like domain-containing protein [Planctomycetota bacterium]